MYIIIKRDKAEHLKEKMHAIKSAALEVLECIEAARHIEHEEEHYADYARGRGRSMSRGRERDYDDYDDYEHDHARGRGRGRY